MTFLAGDNLTAQALNKAIAQAVRYERQAGVQTQTTSTDMQVQFPVAVNPHPDVVASGTGNDAFTVATGIWLVTSAIRLGVAHASREMTIAAGAAAWVAGNIIGGAGSSSLTCGASGLVIATSPTVVTVGTWQASGGNIDVAAFGHTTHIAFARLA